MRGAEQRRLAGLVLLVWVPACTPIAVLTRPEGAGGWDAGRRRTEIVARAEHAGVPLEPIATPPAAGEPLSLARALATATHANYRIRDASAQVDAAAARVRDARGRLLPSLTGSGRYTWYTDPQTTSVSLPPGILPPGVTPEVTVRESEFGVLNGTLAVPVDLSGELYHLLTAAQAGYRGERARQWATTLVQQIEVVRTYYRLLEVRRLADVARARLALERGQLTNAERRFTAGRLTKNEVLVVQVAARNTEQIVLQRELDASVTCWTLNDTIGRPVDTPCVLVDIATPPTVPAVDDALRTGVDHNPTLAALLEEQQRLEEAATSIARGFLPRFSAGAAVDYSSAEIVEPQAVGSGFVGVTVDPGLDGRRAAQLAEARIAADRNRLAVERQLRELEAAIRSTQSAVTERLAALATADTAVAQAEENLRIRDKQFEVGRAESTDVLDAQALVAAQKATQASALYQAHARRAELQGLMGLPLEALAEEVQ